MMTTAMRIASRTESEVAPTPLSASVLAAPPPDEEVRAELDESAIVMPFSVGAVGGARGAGGAVQLPPGGAGEQIVQAAAYSTMVSHQVACFVDAGSEAGAKAAAEKDAAAALIQNAAARA